MAAPKFPTQFKCPRSITPFSYSLDSMAPGRRLETVGGIRRIETEPLSDVSTRHGSTVIATTQTPPVGDSCQPRAGVRGKWS